jgi:hypothetical protein
MVLVARPAILEAKAQHVYAGLIQVTQRAGLIGDRGDHNT